MTAPIRRLSDYQIGVVVVRRRLVVDDGHFVALVIIRETGGRLLPANFLQLLRTSACEIAFQRAVDRVHIRGPLRKDDIRPNNCAALTKRHDRHLLFNLIKRVGVAALRTK